MSRSIFLLLARCALLALLPGATLFAQIKPYQPNEVLLGVRGKLRVNGLYYMNAAASSSPGTRVLDVAPDNGPNKATTTDGANFAFSVKPGQLYSFQFSAGDYDWADIQFDVPAGYVLKIGRPYCPLSPRTTFRAQGSISYSVNLTLTPADGLFSLAAGYGTNPSLQPKVNWGISLGAMPDGNWAGAVRWWQREFDDALLSNSSLSYDGSVAQGIYTAAYADGSLKYIDADNVIVVIERGANRGYWIKFYTGDTVVTGITADTDHVPNVNGATPYVTYEVSNPNPNGSTLDPAYGIDLKRTQPYLDDAGNPATKTDHWVIKRRASDNALVMSQADGTRDVVVVATAPSGGQWTETTTVGTVSKVQRTFQTFPWGTEITSEVNDPQGAALTTTYDYHTGSYSYYNAGAVYWAPGSASVGKLKKITRPDGSWETYSYYEDSARYGQLKQVLRPWDDAPSETSGTAQVMSYAYAAESIATNANVQIVPGLSFLSQLAGIETQVGATSVGRVYYSTPTATVDPSNGFPVFDPLPITLSTDYSVWPSGDAPIVTRTQRAYSGASAYETTVTRTFASWANPDYAGKLYSQTNPDGTRTSASYHTGTYADYTDSTTQWSQTGFAPGAGSARCDTFLTGASTNPGMGAVQFTTDTISSTAIDPVWMVPFKSLRTQTIYDVFARPVLNLTYVFVGGTSFQLIGWEKRAYNSDGTLASKQTHTGELWSGTYVAGRLRTETRPDGTITKYTYNALNQVTEREELGQPGETPIWPDQDSLRTLYTVDLLGRVTQTIVAASNNQPGRVTSASYNLAGQLVSETAEDGLSTTYVYTNSGRTVTATLPGGATKVVNRLRDGTTASVTGTAVVAEYYSKSIGTGGSVIQQTNLATASSPRWVKSYRDWLGRTTREERPTTLAGITFNKISVYNTSGQLIRLEQTNLANTLYTYNGLGELEFYGLDVNGNGQLDLASMDRIQKSETSIITASGAWWTQTLNYVYNQDNSATPLQQSKQLTRLLPYAGGNYAGGVAFLQSHSYDLFGNATVATTTLNRPARLVTVTTDVPDSSVDDITWTRNGLLLKKQTAQNLTYRYTYDHYRRLIGEVDPRTGNAETAYYPNGNLGAAGKVQFKKDTAGNQTSYVYQSDTGLLAWSTDPLGKQNYHVYNQRGQETRSWGPAAYPIEYEYNAYGERTKMRTWRATAAAVNDVSWGGVTYPSATGDATTWAYDPATGTLTSKTDADNKTVSYTYDARLQLKTRTWARNVTTTYSYSAVTGEQTGIDYSDSTPDLSYTYNRLGQTATVTDATGTRTFNYSPANTLLTREDFGAFLGTRSVNYQYDSLGRKNYLGVGLTANPGGEYNFAYGYDALGRMNQVGPFSYTYTPNSNLLASIADTQSAWTQTRTYESNRDLLDVIETKWSTTAQARFDYTTDALGRRTNVSQSGTMFARYVGAGAVRKWTYNDRSEVTDDSGYFGQDPALATTRIPGRKNTYAFDNLGNRTNSAVDDRTGSYTTNGLNQYTQRAVPGYADASGLAPAAATVTVNGATASRVGDYFWSQISADNSAGARYFSFPIVSSYGGSFTRLVFLPGTPETFTYDLDGNLTSDGRWDYTYDAENRLVSIQTKPALIGTVLPAADARRIEFKTDYLGRRAQKTVRSGWNGSLYATVASDLKFLYDGWHLIHEFDTATMTQVRGYVWGLDWSGTLQGAGGVGGLLLVHDFASGLGSAPAYDGNGNLMGLVYRTSGAVAAAYEYDAFGQTLRAEGPLAQSNPFRFSTKYTDNETGLVYYGLRYYSPSLGRFVCRDPKEEMGGINLYAFIRNNAVNGWDYLGMNAGFFSCGWSQVFNTGWTGDDLRPPSANFYGPSLPDTPKAAPAGGPKAAPAGGPNAAPAGKPNGAPGSLPDYTVTSYRNGTTVGSVGGSVVSVGRPNGSVSTLNQTDGNWNTSFDFAYARSDAPNSGAIAYPSSSPAGTPQQGISWGVGVSASATLGAGFEVHTSSADGRIGFNANGAASAGVGVFLGKTLTLGGYTSTGVDTRMGNSQGAAAGGGFHFWLSNAGAAESLKATTKTAFFNVGFGADLGVSVSWGNDIWIIEISPPNSTAGGGIGAGELSTDTKSTTIRSPGLKEP